MSALAIFRQQSYGRVLTYLPQSQVIPIASNRGGALMVARYKGHRSELDVAFAIWLGLPRMLLAIRLAIERHIALGGPTTCKAVERRPSGARLTCARLRWN